MRVHKPIGSKERFLEMFEKVNKIKINESKFLKEDISDNEFKEYEKFFYEALKSHPKWKEEYRDWMSRERMQNWVFSVVDGLYDIGRDDILKNRDVEAFAKELENYTEHEADMSASEPENRHQYNFEESFDVPKPKDKEYLDKTQGDQDSQVSKYDGGVDYPAIDDLKVDDPALKKVTEDDINEISDDTIMSASQKAYDKGQTTRASNFGKHMFKDMNLMGKEFDGGVIKDFGLQNGVFYLELSDTKNWKWLYNSANDVWYVLEHNGRNKNPNDVSIARKDAVILVKITKKLNPSTTYTHATDFRISTYESNEPSLSEEENIDEISWGGIKNVGKSIGNDIKKGVTNVANKVSSAVQSTTNAIGNSISNYVDQKVKDYHRGARNTVISDLEAMASKFGDEFGKSVAKINDRAQKAGDEPINVKSLVQVIANAIYNKARSGGGNFSLSRYRNEGAIHEDEHTIGYEDQIEGGLADDAEPQEFDIVQLLKGIEVEMEHTNDPKIAIEIAMDHLMEIPDYYDRLDDMESDALSDEPSEEDLLDPSSHWVDHYSPKNVGEGELNYPHPMSDPEAGEDEYDEMEDLKKKGFHDEEDVNESDWVRGKQDELPDDVNIPISSIDPNDDMLLGRQVPSITQGDVKTELSTPSHVERWKNDFIRMHGNEGNLVKDDFFKNSYMVVGNESHAKSMEDSNAAKGSWMDSQRATGKNRFLDHDNPEEEMNQSREEIKYNYDNKGNFIPAGYEDSKVALRRVEYPMNSNNWKTGIVRLDNFGEIESFIVKPEYDWDEAKEKIKEFL